MQYDSADSEQVTNCIVGIVMSLGWNDERISGDALGPGSWVKSMYESDALRWRKTHDNTVFIYPPRARNIVVLSGIGISANSDTLLCRRRAHDDLCP